MEELYLGRYYMEDIYYKEKKAQFIISRRGVWNLAGPRPDGSESVTTEDGCS